MSKKYIVLVIAVLMVMILLTDAVMMYFYFKAHSTLEAEADRLLYSAWQGLRNKIAWPDIEAVIVEGQESPFYAAIQNTLIQHRRIHGLGMIYLVMPDGEIVVSTQDNPNGELLAVPDALNLQRGKPMFLALRKIDGIPFKTGCFPVMDEKLVFRAVLVIDAPFSFYNNLDMLRSSILFGGAGLNFVVLILILVLVWVGSILRKLQNELEKKKRLALVGQMTSGIAHEIKNPLSIVKGSADALKRRYSGDEIVKFIEDEVIRMEQIMRDFLSFAKDISLEKSPVHWGQAISAWAEKYHRPLEEKGVNLRVNTTNADYICSIDEMRLHQVFDNLVLNAMDAVKAGAKIEITATVQNNHVRLAVFNTGNVIPSDVLGKIFEPFFTTKGNGTGLGLAICRNIIESHGGRIKVENKSNGVEFEVII